MSRILLLLDQKENQRLLSAELGRAYDVVAATGDEDLEGDYDLLVIDGRALDRSWERVQERRRSARPLYLPVLLVTSRPDVKMITRHLWRSVDELIITPIEKAELRARVEVLLRVRAQSRELRERAEAAERAVATRDEVMAMVSHDLRNPLNVVLSYAGLLLDTGKNLEPVQRSQLGAIHEAVNRMTRLTQDLLDVSGLESGTLTTRPADVAVAPIVRDACEPQSAVARMKNVALTWEIEDGLPALRVDRGRMDQLFANLIGNAIKFTPEGGAVVVRARRGDRRVRFTVSDTGPGLSEQEAARVFDRFWRGRSAEAGAGLGLAIARAIVEAHGGRIGVTSAPGQGAEFWFEIPVAER